MRRGARDIEREGQRGFTLVEAVIVMVITGILAGIVAMFISRPVQGYMDIARRAELTDIADTALRRIARDLHLALPNSVVVNVVGPTRFLTYVPTSGGGRYRAEGSDRLDFTQPDTTFDVLGPVPAFQAGDQIVVYNLGVPGADVYLADNQAPYVSLSENTVTIGAKKFPFESPGYRFHVTQAPVIYACSPTSTGGDGTLRRSGFLLASNVTACAISYTPGVTERSGLVVMQLTITRDGESATLVHQVHVNNVP